MAEEKKMLSAREVVEDLRAGATDAFLMKKYGVSEKGLESLFQKLITARILTQGDLDRRSRVGEEVEAIIIEGGEGKSVNPTPPSAQPLFKCPACNFPQSHDFQVCPQCGVIIEKFHQRAESKARELQTAQETNGQSASNGMRSKPIKSRVSATDEATHCFPESKEAVLAAAQIAIPLLGYEIVTTDPLGGLISFKASSSWWSTATPEMSILVVETSNRYCDVTIAKPTASGSNAKLSTTQSKSIADKAFAGIEDVLNQTGITKKACHKCRRPVKWQEDVSHLLPASLKPNHGRLCKECLQNMDIVCSVCGTTYRISDQQKKCPECLKKKNACHKCGTIIEHPDNWKENKALLLPKKLWEVDDYRLCPECLKSVLAESTFECDHCGQVMEDYKSISLFGGERAGILGTGPLIKPDLVLCRDCAENLRAELEASGSDRSKEKVLEKAKKKHHKYVRESRYLNKSIDFDWLTGEILGFYTMHNFPKPEIIRQGDEILIQAKEGRVFTQGQPRGLSHATLIKGVPDDFTLTTGSQKFLGFTGMVTAGLLFLPLAALPAWKMRKMWKLTNELIFFIDGKIHSFGMAQLQRAQQPQNPRNDDIPAQIEKLADLRNKEIISEEEFNRKKEELLARM